MPSMARTSGDDAEEPAHKPMNTDKVRSDKVQAVDSLSGLRAFRVSSSALQAANQEANAGLVSKAKTIAAAVTRKKKGKERADPLGGLSSSRLIERSPIMHWKCESKSDFIVRAVDDDNDFVFRTTVKPEQNHGRLVDLEKKGRVKFDVTFNKSWDSVRVDQAIRDALPAFFNFCKNQQDYASDQRTYVLCYAQSRQLSVYAKLEPDGEDLFKIRCQKGRGQSESMIHIASILSIPDEVLQHTSSYSANKSEAEQVHDHDSNHGDSVKFEPSESRNSTMKACTSKGKKRSRAVVSSDSEDDIKIIEPPPKASKCIEDGASANPRSSKLLKRLDDASRVGIVGTTRRSTVSLTDRSEGRNEPSSSSNLNAIPSSSRSTTTLSNTLPSSEPITHIDISDIPSNLDISNSPVLTPEIALLPLALAAAAAEGLISVPYTALAKDVAGPSTPLHRTPAPSHNNASVIYHSPHRWDLPDGMSDPWSN
ncbi:hypothetical protein BDY19DRAFT_1053863 [Irpex rosettiformis]|uniref:Uncharacterized protein n=1 Tax=Irpex rosettiformis TaxID=378272 RepID=A0ACB8UGW9_9APHY|nr:hypothetical protein BDY19DRAFT_1053863 [Irpex rosettiformis]